MSTGLLEGLVAMLLREFKDFKALKYLVLPSFVLLDLGTCVIQNLLVSKSCRNALLFLR